MREAEYLRGILGALGVGEDSGVPDPVWRQEEYLKALYDAVKGARAVKYDEQELTIGQKKQALLNLDGVRIVKLTDADATLAELNEMLAEINTDGEHVFFDVSALGYPLYLCTIAVNRSGAVPVDYRLSDLVTGSVSTGAYAASKTLAQILAEAGSPAFPVNIAVTAQPAKTGYEIGDNFDPAGMAVTMTLADGSTTVLDNGDLTFTPASFDTAGTQTVTITYQEGHYALSATLTVSVTEITLNTWAKRRQVSVAGLARNYYQVGDLIQDTYTVNGISYPCNWIVMDFADVEDENGTVYHDIPILQMQRTGHEIVAFDAKEETLATEATAQNGYYYCGYDGTNYTMLNLAAGDTIPYGSYTKVYKTLWNSVNAIRYGLSSWKHSFVRQYLNHSGTGWAEAQHACDVLPGNAATMTGFMSRISAEMAAALHPIKITTQRPNFMGGGADTTYDVFWLASVSQMNMQNANASPDEGDPWAYYQALFESGEKVNTGAYDVLKRYDVTNATSVREWWTRSAILNNMLVWGVNTSGNTGNNSASYSFRVLPVCAIF